MMNKFSRSTKFLFPLLLVLALSCATFAQEDDQLTGPDLSSAKLSHMAAAPRGHRNGQGHAQFGIPGIDFRRPISGIGIFQLFGVDVFGDPQVIWHHKHGRQPSACSTTD